MNKLDNDLAKLEREILTRELSRRSFSSFVKYIKPDYDMRWFHQVIADHLDLVYAGKIKKLMIFVPPQHGKSELSTRSFPAYLLGRNPDLKLALASVNRASTVV